MPKMKAVTDGGLTAKQLRFVEALLANGGNKTEAAKAAGYGEASAHVTGHRLTKNPKVRAALAEATTQILADAAPKAAQAIEGLLTHKSGYVRLEAAKDILDRNAIGTSRQPAGGQGLVVNINLGDDSSGGKTILDVTPTGGGGQKTSRSTPLPHPDT